MTLVLGPTAHRLSPILTVTEQNGQWLKGHAVYDPDVAVELSFEMHGHKQLCFPGTPWTVIAMFRLKQNIFEFNLGKSSPPKGGVDADAIAFLANLKQLSFGHNPVPVVDAHVSATKKSLYKAHKPSNVGYW